MVHFFFALAAFCGNEFTYSSERPSHCLKASVSRYSRGGKFMYSFIGLPFNGSNCTASPYFAVNSDLSFSDNLKNILSSWTPVNMLPFEK